MQLSNEQNEQLLDELRSGRKLNAVKLCRQWTKCSLLEAKNQVERLAETGLEDEELQHSELDETVIDDVLDAIQRGDKIEAIKLYRESSGVSLKAAKEFIERLVRELDVEHQQGRVGCAAAFVIAILAVGFTMAATS